jgi:hypothetical protein
MYLPSGADPIDPYPESPARRGVAAAFSSAGFKEAAFSMIAAAPISRDASGARKKYVVVSMGADLVLHALGMQSTLADGEAFFDQAIRGGPDRFVGLFELDETSTLHGGWWVKSLKHVKPGRRAPWANAVVAATFGVGLLWLLTASGPKKGRKR